MKKLLILCISVLFTNINNAQNYNDAARFSALNPSSTARSLGTGGALGAIGAEFLTLSTNPAGIGMYRHSEFVISPGFHSYKGISSFEGNEMDARKNKLHLGNIGIVFNTNHSGTWKSLNFGIGVNLLKKFDSRLSYSGKSHHSIVQSMIEHINGKAEKDFYFYDEQLVWDAQAIFPKFGQTNEYGSDFDNLPDDAKIDINENVWNYGHVRELVFGFGGNYDGKLMLGGSIGVPFATFRQIRRMNEEDTADVVPSFNNLKMEQDITSAGIGINAKFGIIYKPIQSIRIGLAMHTPTLYAMKDNFSRNLEYNFTFDGSTTSNSAKTGSSSFDYKLNTPWKVAGSFGFVAPKIGIFSADVEWVDYANSYFEYDSEYSTQESKANIGIEDHLVSNINLRLGADIGTKEFRFRAGYGLLGAPIKDVKSTQNFSLGVGIVQENYFIDMAFQKTFSKSQYSPYTIGGENLINVAIDENISKLLLTVGFKF